VASGALVALGGYDVRLAFVVGWLR